MVPQFRPRVCACVLDVTSFMMLGSRSVIEVIRAGMGAPHKIQRTYGASADAANAELELMIYLLTYPE